MTLPTVEEIENDEETDKRCRYCFGGSQGWVTCESLISPCLCTGSLAFVHKSCLEKWLNIKNIKICDICHFPFETRWRYKSITEWEFLEIPLEEILLIIFAILMYITFILQFLGAAYIGMMASTLELAVLAVTLSAFCLGLIWFLVGCISLTGIIYTSDYWIDWRKANKRQYIVLTTPKQGLETVISKVVSHGEESPSLR